MANSHSTATPEATKTSAIAHPPVPDVQKASEPEIDRSGMLGARAIQAIGGGSPETSPEQYAGALGQLSGRSQTGMLRQLQRSYGNSYVGRVIQAKLTVNQPGDIYEQEADRMAAQVMTIAAPQSDHSIQREIEPKKQKEKIQMMPSLQLAADGNREVGGNLENQLNSSKGGGSPLPNEVRSFMEPRFGADFSQVRVHTGSEAVQMNRELGAQAFTHGSDVYFGPGKSPGINELTAHELTHVVQQTGGVQTKLTLDQTDVQRKCSACEQEEETVQRSLNVSAVSDSEIQRWSLFGDDEDKTESESSSSGGILDWVEEKVSEAVNSVTQAGSDAYNWAKEKGGATVDTVTQAGSDVYDWAKEKANLLAQLSGAIQRLSGQEFISLTDDQLATLNGHCAALREKSQGAINPPEITGRTDSAISTAAPGTNLVSASTVKTLLLHLQSSVSAPFLSSDSAANTPDSQTSQGSIQRTALAPPIVGAGVGGAVGGPPGATIGFIIGIFVMIVMIILAAPLIAQKVKEKPEPLVKVKKWPRFPGGCDRATLISFAEKCGMDVQPGGNHYNVFKNGQKITQIPHTVKENGTCKAIIDAIAANCY